MLHENYITWEGNTVRVKYTQKIIDDQVKMYYFSEPTKDKILESFLDDEFELAVYKMDKLGFKLLPTEFLSQMDLPDIIVFNA